MFDFTLAGTISASQAIFADDSCGNAWAFSRGVIVFQNAHRAEALGDWKIFPGPKISPMPFPSFENISYFAPFWQVALIFMQKMR